MEIIWTQKARNTYWNNVDYLIRYWNENVVDDFENETLRTIEIILKNPTIGRYDEQLKCNIILIVKQISLFYEIKNDKIILLIFWNNRQKPLKRLDI